MFRNDYIIPMLEHFNDGPPTDLDFSCVEKSSTYTLIPFKVNMYSCKIVQYKEEFNLFTHTIQAKHVRTIVRCKEELNLYNHTIKG